MNAEVLSRLQFALTASFHFIYPPLSMGLGIMLIVLGVAYVRTNDPKWRQLAFFWVKIYGLIFAVGVATGIVQEFEFGTNWANYSRFVGSVFGSLLAAEGVFAFFLEGGFLGLMLFGGNRLGPKMWLTATILVVFGAHFSALWIVMANSWMQTPAGFEVVNGTAVMTSFSEVMFTPSFLSHIFHVFIASWTAGAALVLSVAAFYLLRKRHIDLSKSMVRVALPAFILFAGINLFVAGPVQAIEVTNNQPLKLASMEGLWDTQSCAPLMIVGWVDVQTQTTTGIGVPCMLSFLAYGNINATVQGITAFPQQNWPSPMNLLFQAYHWMFNFGVIFFLVGLLGAVMWWWKKRVFTNKLILWLFVIAIFFVESAIIAGWWTAEIGRQPWVVYNVLTTADGVSPVLTTEQVGLSLGMFLILYTTLFALFIYLLNGKIHSGPEPLEVVAPVPVSELPSTFREIFRSRGSRASN